MTSFLSWLAARMGSFRFALRGLYFLTQEPNARVHLVVGSLVLVFSVWQGIRGLDLLWVIAAVFLVLITETINTALERLADAAMPEWHPLVGKAKDLAAGAVLLSAVFAVLVAIFVLWPKLNLLMA